MTQTYSDLWVNAPDFHLEDFEVTTTGIHGDSGPAAPTPPTLP